MNTDKEAATGELQVPLQLKSRLNNAFEAQYLLRLLARHGLLPQLQREVILDEAIAPYAWTAAEEASSLKQFLASQHIADEAECERWLVRHGMSRAALVARAVRPLRIEKFCEATWGSGLKEYFQSRKASLDQVVYSLIRTQDAGVAQEVYFRIREGEQSFAELARLYSQGPEAQSGGLLGPFALSVPHPELARLLAASRPGKLWPPTRLGEWLVIVRLERFIPARFDEAMRRQLLGELFENWVRERLESGDFGGQR